MEKRIKKLEKRIIAFEDEVQGQASIKEIESKIKILQMLLILVPISIIVLNVFFLRILY